MFVVHMRDGKTLTEGQVNWKEIPVQDITSLQLYHTSGRKYTVSADGKNVKFIQLKRAITGSGPLPQGICERVIGVVVGDLAVKMEVDERSGNVRLTVEKKEQVKGGKWRKL